MIDNELAQPSGLPLGLVIFGSVTGFFIHTRLGWGFHIPPKNFTSRDLKGTGVQNGRLQCSKTGRTRKCPVFQPKTRQIGNKRDQHIRRNWCPIKYTMDILFRQVFCRMKTFLSFVYIFLPKFKICLHVNFDQVMLFC